MILELFRFELREQLRSPLLWFIAGLFALLAFGAASSEAVQLGGSIGNVYRNAPTVIATWLAMFTLLGMLVITIFIANALLRDFEQGTAELFFTAPIRKRDYLSGRLSAALVASLFVYLLIAVGMFVAQFMPWIDPARLGPVSLKPYVWSLAVFVLPNVLFTGAVLALLAVVTRSILWVYIGVIGFFVLYAVSGVLMSDLDSVWIATLTDPLGIRALARTVRYWSVEERNTGLPAVAGYLLANRVAWTIVAVAMFAAAFALFKTERSGTARRRWGRKRAPVQAGPGLAMTRITPAHKATPTVSPSFSVGTAWSQFLRQVRFDTLGVFRSVPFLIMLALGVSNFVPAALLGRSMFGTPIYPVTSQMLALLQGSYSFLLIIIVLFYAGELVWKERTAKINEVTDAMPVPDWVPLLAKFVALIAVVLSFQLFGALTSMTVQLIKGYTQLEPLVYLKILSVDSVTYVLMGGMALVLQVFSNNKFVGYGLLIVLLIGQTVLGLLDFSHNLYNFGNWPIAPYSDMNGYGHFLLAQLWFQSYWVVFLGGMLLLAAAFWVRGVDHGRKQRWALAKRRLHGRLGAALSAAAVGFVAIGGFLFWNTNIRNDYRSPEQELDLQARYEREYGKYRDLPQPKILASTIDIDLRPETQALLIRGTYRITNPHAGPINDVHIALAEDKALTSIDIGGAKLTRHDPSLGYRIYRLTAPLQPGEQRELRFGLDYRRNGFTNGAPDTQVVENGTFFNNRLFPQFGYAADREIQDRNDRRKRGLGEPRRMPKLEDTAARSSPYIGDDANWIDFRTTICTAPDQIALAPGYLQREFRRDGRRCFSYAMDRPMLDFYAFVSARWVVKRGAYTSTDGRPIAIEIYYDPKHAYNVDRMIEATQKSLAYFETNFTPYQHRQVRIVEFPGYAGFAQSFANTIPYSESIGFIADLRDEDEIDYVFYVTAHEVAHQWWAHQVIGGNVQGAAMLAESLAQYSALMVMEREYGRGQMRRFLKHELDSYLRDRGGERLDEMPLYRVENQQYIYYNKGSLVFYRLREEMGEERLNRALKKFLQDKGYQQPPYTTSAELLDYLRAEAKPEQRTLIADLFEKISFYDNRVEKATAHRRSDGKYEVVLDLFADKRYADGKGKETAAKLDDWIEVGVFGAGSGKDAAAPVLFLKRIHVTSAHPTVKVVVDALPHEAGFDPYNKLIDRVSEDNRKPVTVSPRAGG